MEGKTFRDFHRDLSWSTRIYTLMTIATIFFAYLWDAWGSNWVMTIISTLSIILFVETFAMYFQKHPKAWGMVKWILLLLLLILILTGVIK